MNLSALGYYIGLVPQMAAEANLSDALPTNPQRSSSKTRKARLLSSSALGGRRMKSR
jgi:hypothetical protein